MSKSDSRKSKKGKKPFLPPNVKETALNKLIDLLIVIAGITIAFQLNNMKQRSDQRSLEKYYLESLHSDLSRDIERMEYIEKDLAIDLAYAGLFLGRSVSKIPPDSLNKSVIEILAFTTFSTRNANTYNTLLNSNGMNVISNRDIRTLITEFYKTYGTIDRFEEIYTEFLLSHFHPHFSPYYNYTTERFTNPAVLQQQNTINSMFIAVGQLSEGVEDYQDGLLKAKELLALIERELDNE